MKKPLLTLALALLAAGAGAQGTKPLPSLHVEGKWLADTHGNHVVLHGVMDTPSAWFNSGRWGWSYDDAGRQRCLSYFEKLFAGLEQAHCNVFRLHLEPAWTNDNAYTYAPAATQAADASGEADIRHFNPTRLTNYMKTLYFPLMQKAMRHGMYVVVRPPGVCPGDLRVGDYYQEYLLQVWDIVTKNDSIRKYAGQVSIELANEPVRLKNSLGQDDKKALHDYFQPVVDRIRQNGFTGIVWVPGTGWQSSYADYKTYPIEGYNIGYAVHDYDGWYGCADKNLTAANLEQAKKNKISQFRAQVPVVDTNPVIVTEIDWSPTKPGTGHYNEHGDWVESNYGTWATGRTSMWGTVTKAVHDHYGNISMTLSGTSCLIDVDTLISKNKVVAAFGALPEACGKACMDWYADYYRQNYPKADFTSVPVSDRGTKYENPVVRADFPDPDVIRVADTYYMVSTTMHHFPGATILKSQDMVNWEYCAQPLRQVSASDAYLLKDGQNAYARGMWACSMKYHEGKFYILINCNEQYGLLLTATNPEGRWTVKKLARGYYDPGMLFDGGKVYVACGINRIMMCELDEQFNFRREKEVVFKEGTGLEGCHLYKHGDYYYIYATYGGWPSGQTVFRSKSIFGPYEEHDGMLVDKVIDGQPNTIHQGALIEDTQGKWWTVMQQDLGALGRMPNLQPVTWKDDWPVVGNGGKPYATYTKPKAVGDNGVKRLPTTDVFRTFPLGQQWQWNHNPDAGAWSLTERPGWLRLRTSGIAGSLPQARGMLTQRIFADASRPTTGTACIDVSHLADGDRTGLCVFQDPYAAIAVERKDGRCQLVWWQDQVRDAGQGFKAAEQRQDLELADSTVYLRAAFDYATSKCRFYYSTDNQAWTPLGGETTMGFNLSVFVGARFGLFCYATRESGGWADVDWFSTEDGFDEATLYPATFTAPEAARYTATKVAPVKNAYSVMVGGWRTPVVNATFQDRHAEDVTAVTAMAPEEQGIVECYGGRLYGRAQGSTEVKAEYTDAMGNRHETNFTANVSYFPTDPQYVNDHVVGANTYRQNTLSSVFRFVKDGQMGWVYDDAVDWSDYRYLVVTLQQKQTADAHLNIYVTASVKGACHSTAKFGDQTQVVVDLQQAKYTSTTSKGRPLDLSHVRMVTFTGAVEGKLLTLKDMFLTNDERYNPTGISTVAAAADGPVDVYTLGGQRVRTGAPRHSATDGLPAGIYIVGGRKTVVRK